MFNWQLLWDGYPHASMRLSLKFYMLNQVRGFPIVHAPSFNEKGHLALMAILCLPCCVDGLLASLLSRALLHESQEGNGSRINPFLVCMDIHTHTLFSP